MFRNKKMKTLLGLGLVLVFFILGGPNCLPGGEDNNQGTGPNTGGGGYYPGGGGTGGNSPPWVNIMTPNMQVGYNQMVNLTANAGDNENDPLTFEWGCSNGFFNGPMAGPSVSWTSPSFDMGAKIWVKVRDGRGGENYAEIFINVGNPPNPGGPNNPPYFTDVHSDFSQVGPNGRVRLFATANDPNFDMVKYDWRITNGPANFSNDSPDGSSVDWTAPNMTSGPGSYDFYCEADDGKGGITQSMHFLVYMNYGGGGYNQPPTSFSISASQTDNIAPDQVINLTSTVTDPEGDPFMYNWSAVPDVSIPNIGTFMPNPTASNPAWQAPHINVSQLPYYRTKVWFTIFCEIKDNAHNHTLNRSIPSIGINVDTTH